MMKKCIFFGVIVMFLFSLFGGSESKLFLEDAIRFRVIANSNSSGDQEIKREVASVLEEEISSRLTSAEDINDARYILASSLPEFENIVNETLVNNKVQSTFKINYGMNYFPEKTYMGVAYPEGEYESLVVTLGDGMGDNWWCVLFPPVCLMEAEESEGEEVEYHFFLQEFFENLFS